MIRFIVICFTVIRTHEEIAVVAGDPLNPLRRILHLDPAEIFAGLKIVFIEIIAALICCPGTHPDNAVVRIHSDSGAFDLTA